jgi:drug/metabolite transporter (DMT)-like permease
MRFKANLTLLFVAAVWGSAFVSQRLVGLDGNVFIFNGARFILGALVLSPLFIWQKVGLFKQGQFLWMAIAGTVLFIASALQQAGLQYTTAGNAGFFTSLYVVLVPLVILIGWKERPYWLAWVAVTLAGVGAFLLSTAGRFEVQPGDMLELVGAVFWAFHVVLIGKFASRYHALSFSVGQFVVGGILNLITGLIFEHPAPETWGLMTGAILYTGIFSVAIGYTLQVWSQQHTPPTDAALIMSLEAVFAVIFGWLILGEALLPIQIFGCMLILFAVVLAQLRIPDKIGVESGTT